MCSLQVCFISLTLQPQHRTYYSIAPAIPLLLTLSHCRSLAMDTLFLALTHPTTKAAARAARSCAPL